MGRKNYLVEGLSGTGKTSVAEELQRRGHHVVHGDRELAYQGDPATGEPITEGGGHEHHLWDVAKVRALVADQAAPATFFCGGSRNFAQFLDLFDAVVVLEVDLDTLERRLDARPDAAWGGGQPTDRARIRRWHQSGEDVPQGALAVDATAPLGQVVDEILRRCRPEPSVFTGLSAFPLTPLVDDRVDGAAFAGLVDRLVTAGVDSVTALGSTGSYPYLSRDERAAVARTAVEHAGGVPVVVGVGALRTSHVLQHVEDAQTAGAAGVLLAPLSYQALTDDDVHGLYEDVTRELSVPLVVYDNPGTTRFTFTDALYRAVAALPHVASVKIPGVPADPARATARVQELRALLPPHVTVGVSGDSLAATGLDAGCDAWYSVIAGTLPAPALALTRAARDGDADGAAALSVRLEPLWGLFARHGSYRVVACIAELLGLVTGPCLPRPVRGLDQADRAEVAAVLAALELGGADSGHGVGGQGAGTVPR